MHPPTERQTMDVDIACVGFGPATAGFLHRLSRGLLREDGTPVAESQAVPGLPPQVICYERADDVGFGVSGVVTRGRALRASLPELASADPPFPLLAPVHGERVAYLLDPHGASRRPWLLRAADALLKPFAGDDLALELPYLPPFLRKEPGLVFALGQFSQWIAGRLLESGLVQVWPGQPVAEAILEDRRVAGLRLLDQGVDRKGQPTEGFLPGLEVRARLTVVGDGPVGAVSQQLDEHFGLPHGHHRREWAVGMKFVVELPGHCTLPVGTVLHTLGYPEPEIFGFLYVLPNRMASLGVFVPSWYDNPARTAYRYLQHWMLHPYLWRHLRGGTLRSWGAKSINECGREGEPWLVGDGYARIGENSGSTNVLTNSGVDEAWATGTQLAEAVLELLAAGKPFTRENLESTYVARRRASWLEGESRVAEKARHGFSSGFLEGMAGVVLAGFSGGRLHWPARPRSPHTRLPSLEQFYEPRLSRAVLARIRKECQSRGQSIHDELMNRAGWPAIPLDGKLLVSQQDALLLGGKVQAPPGFADHVLFRNEYTCASCDTKVCVEACSGQALTIDPVGGRPLFDREKCVHCGVCRWNCSRADVENPDRGNIVFTAGAGGLHSAEN